MHDNSNQYFQLAYRFISQTKKPIFLTGKAGTGKTTFLKYVRDNCFKKMAVVAPTGVAAINAGGVTMHSLFQLPLGIYLPTLQTGWNSNGNFTNQHHLFKNLRYSDAKRTLLQELELLIIDEVSMVRADMLDAADVILRHYRHRLQQPFGGVQVLFIGDLFQLPPVVSNAEWDVMKGFYKSPFFFDALVLQQEAPVYIELKKIYRQSDATFINILNNVRNNVATGEDLERLHKNYKPGYKPQINENYITLTSHNAKAEVINQSRLAELPGKLYSFEAEIIGDFPDHICPAEKLLQLKRGAQVMFIKNDKGEVRRYFNGKIGVIENIDEQKITVVFANNPDKLIIEREVWKNIRYNYNKERDNIEEDELGSFTQYPVKLAWAVTIHKSQGLTFEKAIIDAGASFAPGQVYVALSRLTSLDGMILHSRILPHCISTDERVIQFSETEPKEDVLQQSLEKEQQEFMNDSLLQAYDLSKLKTYFIEFYDDYQNRQIPDKNEAIAWAKKLFEQFEALHEVAAKFMNQLARLLPVAVDDNYKKLHERVAAASNHFDNGFKNIASPIEEHIKAFRIKQKTKKYVVALRDLELLITRKQQQILQTAILTNEMKQGKSTGDLLAEAEEKRKLQTAKTVTTIAEQKQQKGDTQRLSLLLFKEGKTVGKIAALRGLNVNTIEGHLAEFIKTGEVEISQLVSMEKIAIIKKAIEETNTRQSSLIREKLSNDFSYSEIKAVINHLEWMQQKIAENKIVIVNVNPEN